MITYRDEDFPMGLRCPECKRTFHDGDPISERLDGFQDDIPICVLVCVGCGLKGTD